MNIGDPSIVKALFEVQDFPAPRFNFWRTILLISYNDITSKTIGLAVYIAA